MGYFVKHTWIFFLKVIYKGMIYPGSWTGSTSIDDGFLTVIHTVKE